MIDVVTFAIPGPMLVTPRRFGDQRGFFSEVFNARALRELGIDAEFVQDNHSLSCRPGTVRGLHFQKPPHAQGKLVRVVRGSILDVAVDVRVGSPTFGGHVAVELSAANWAQLWIPSGFAHGFCTLEPDCEVVYKVTAYYAPQCDTGIYWADPTLGIAWPAAEADAVVSEKDAALPRFRQHVFPFVWTSSMPRGRATAFAAAGAGR